MTPMGGVLRPFLRDPRALRSSSSGSTRGIHPPGTTLSGYIQHFPLSSVKHLTSTSSPPSQPMPTISPFRRGYTARRCGEAGPAPGGRKRRKSSHPGFAENGLPPATRGEAEANGPGLRLLMPERARRACLCGTQGGRPDGFAGLMEVRPSLSSRLTRGQGRKVRQQGTVRKGHGRGTGVADKNRRTGR